MRGYSSTIPSFRNESSEIRAMRNNTILTCDDYNGEKRNFIVVDEANLRTHSGTDVETSYNNHWIVDFPAKTEKRTCISMDIS